MYVSRETVEQTHQRLLRVIAGADVDELPGTYAFEELDSLPKSSQFANSLAYVRDSGGWSCLRASQNREYELFAVFRFHFPPGLDNSGFVGWFASHIKQITGSGVFVICGCNQARGGIFDYWGCPAGLREEVRVCIQAMKSGKVTD